MYAIVEIAGKQFKAEKGRYLYVNRLDAEEESTVEFDKVLLISGTDDHVNIGTPTIENAKVEAKVLKHFKGNKVLVFKKKRRKGYQKLNGHRDHLTKIEISNIVY